MDARLIESLIMGVLLIGSFAIEAWVGGSWGLILRVVVVVIHLLVSVPGLVSWSRVNGLGWALRVAMPCAVGGWILAAWFVPLKVGMLHLMFIGGTGVIMLTVASRVILGHNERHDRLASPLKWFHWVWGLALFTAATRLTSEFLPGVRISHFIYAAILWVLTLGFWAWKLRREVYAPIYEEGVIRSQCPRRKKKRGGGSQ